MPNNTQCTSTDLAQCYGDGSEPNKSPFPTVGILWKGEVIAEDLEQLFDLSSVLDCGELFDHAERKMKRITVYPMKYALRFDML